MPVHPMPATPDRFTLHVDTTSGDPVLKCSGRLTSQNSELLRSELKKLLPQHKTIHLDLAELSFMDSSGLGAILGSYVSAKTVGCELRLDNPSKSIRDLLKMTHLSSVFESYGE